MVKHTTEEQEDTLSEYESKQLLRSLGIPVSREVLVQHPHDAGPAATEIGLPVVIKLCGERIAHKTERNLVRLGLDDIAAVERAAADLWAQRRHEDGDVSLLIAEMVSGKRELIAGMVRDPQFGPCILIGLGGILTEALGDVAFAVAPLTRSEAHGMLERVRSKHLVTKSFRGEAPVDREALTDILVGLGRLAIARPDIQSIDINPLIIVEGQPVAVDALVVTGPANDVNIEEQQVEARRESTEDILERFRPLFHPRGIIVAGASSHPGKFGFVTLHNLRRFGYQGEIFPLNRDGAEILGEPTYRNVADIPPDKADLVFVCTPVAANIELLRSCAKIGVRAAFVASGGYRETGEAGRQREDALVQTADELGMLLAGPNGQGLISTPASMCAQIVAPYPPIGRISVVSQSGNLLSAFLNYSVQTGVGISKAISAGNSAQTNIADYLDYFSADAETDVVLAYLEGVPDGRHFIEAVRRLTVQKPLVLIKGGAAAEGQRAALSHTGALATDDRVFQGLCRQFGILRAATIEDAFEWAATLATQPLPRGRRVVIFTTVGGWGVLTADACANAELELVPLPQDLEATISSMVPARWSRNNPIDLAGGETRDTVPEILDLVCAHPEVDAILHLGIGIQAATAQVFKAGEFYPQHGLARMADFHEKQDRRYARAAADASRRHNKPILTTTELVYTDREYGNVGPLAVREAGRVCYPSAHRAVTALRVLIDYAEFRRRHAEVAE